MGLCLALQQKQILKNISFDLRSGEVLGIFGLMGAGRTELTEALMGMHPGLIAGEITLNGEGANSNRPRRP
jgi:ribose transport system ATP-binding protein